MFKKLIFELLALIPALTFVVIGIYKYGIFFSKITCVGVISLILILIKIYYKCKASNAADSVEEGKDQ